jgi:chromatin assembly factor 1 subunit A
MSCSVLVLCAFADQATESLEHHHGIDPFSSVYWEPKAKIQTTPAAAAASTTTAELGINPPPVPTDAFRALTTTADATKLGRGRKPAPTNLTPELVQLLRDTVAANPSLAKAGTIDLFYSQHSGKGCTRAQIQNALAAIAERSGKLWKLKDSIST